MAVVGAEQLRRAFLDAGTSFNADMRRQIRGYAQPVAAQAQLLAQTRIRNINVPWSMFRTGTAPALVYVAPVQRGARIRQRRRPRFGTLLMTRAMEPALDANRATITAKIDALLARMERKYGGA